MDGSSLRDIKQASTFGMAYSAVVLFFLMAAFHSSPANGCLDQAAS
jgi:hypothetical protein